MLRHLFLIAALAVAGVPASTADAQDVGTAFPDIALERFAQTQATSLDDYWGRAILVEFFAHW